MKSQIAKSRWVCQVGLTVPLLCVALLSAAPGRAHAQAAVEGEVQTEAQSVINPENNAPADASVNPPANAPVHAPVLGLVNWPGAVAYPKLNEGKPLMVLAAGERVELLERSNLWWKIRHGDQVGWVNRLFIEVNPTKAIRSEVPKLGPEPEPELEPRSEFHRSMLALGAAWKSKYQSKSETQQSAVESNPASELFSTQLLKNSKMPWAPQVIAPSRLVIGKDYFKLWLKSSKSGYVYVWSEAQDGELTLVFPNQRDVDNRVLAGEVLYLPRKNWPIKSTGPAGLSRLLVMVSEVPRPLPPPESLMEELSSTLAPPAIPSVLGHEILKRHPFWMSSNGALSNTALLHFLNPDVSKDDCNPKKPQCSNNYGVKSVKLMKIEPLP